MRQLYSVVLRFMKLHDFNSLLFVTNVNRVSCIDLILNFALTLDTLSSQYRRLNDSKQLLSFYVQCVYVRTRTRFVFKLPIYRIAILAFETHNDLLQSHSICSWCLISLRVNIENNTVWVPKILIRLHKQITTHARSHHTCPPKIALNINV